MFGPLGLPEIIFIMVLALLIFGPRKLPEIGRTLGRGLAEFRKASSELKRTIDTEMMREELRQNDPRNLLKENSEGSESSTSAKDSSTRSHRDPPPEYRAPDATIARGGDEPDSADDSSASPESSDVSTVSKDGAVSKDSAVPEDRAVPEDSISDRV